MLPEQLGGALEDNILCALCYNGELASTLAYKLDSAMFSTPEYREIAKLAIGYVQKYGTSPGIHLHDMMEDMLRRDSAEARIYKHAFTQMDKLRHELNGDYVLEETDRFVAIRSLGNAIDAASGALERGDVDTARKLLYSDATVTSSNVPEIWLSDAKAMLSFMDGGDTDVFSTGITTLDRMHIRPRRKEMLLVIGAKGTGKSWLSVTCGKQAILHRKSVLHVTLELSAEQTAQRYVQALFALTSNDPATLRLTRLALNDRGQFVEFDYQEVHRQAISDDTRPELVAKLEMFSRRPPLLIAEFPTGGLSPAQLSGYLDSLKSRHNFVPDILVVDSINVMQTKSNTYRLDIGANVRGVRSICQTRNIACVATTQGTRRAAEVDTVKSTHVGEDWSMVGTADTVITYSRTEREYQNGLARLRVEHTRAAKDKFTVLITQAYDIGQYCLDSCILGSAANKARAKLTGEEKDNPDANEESC